MKIKCFLVHSAGLRAKITPGSSATVVRANAREGCYLGLHQRPIRRETTCTNRQNNCRFTLARAVKMKLVAAQINHPPGGRRRFFILALLSRGGPCQRADE